jgi:CHAT domain-containing protein/Tfp pilus assembly protein PilF
MEIKCSIIVRWKASMFSTILPYRNASYLFLRFIGRRLLLLLCLSLPVGTLVAQRSKNGQILVLGKSDERELSGGQSHFYQVVLLSGQYIRVVVDPRGIDMAVTLFSPEGKQIIEVHSPNDTPGSEPVSAIAQTSGTYRLVVRSLEKGMPAGRYKVKIEELRAATEQDKTRIAAEKAYTQAMSLRGGTETAESLQIAIKKYEESLSLYHVIGDRKGEATVLMRIGEVYSLLGEKQKALDYFAQALTIHRAIGNLEGEGDTLNNIGVVYDDLGEKQKALDYYTQALSLRRAVGDQNGEAETLANIGVVYDSFGEKQKALDYFAQAIQLLRAVRDRHGEAATLSNIGGVYTDLGEKQKALTYYGQALTLARAIGDRRGEAITLSNIGGVYKDLGEKQKALDYYAQALPLRRAVGDPDGEAATLLSIGAVYDDLGEQQKALPYYNRALTLFRKLGDRNGEAVTLGDIGVAYYALGDKQKSVESFAQALPIRRAIGDRSGEAVTLTHLMSLYQSQDNLGSAIFYGKQSVDVYQQLRSSIQGLGTDVQRIYLRSIEPTYRGLADLLITQGRFAEAQQVFSGLKDQQFFDVDRTQARQLKPLTRTPREEEFALRYEKAGDLLGAIGGQMAELKRAIGDHQPSDEDAKRLRQVEAQFKTASDEFLAFIKQAENEFSQSPDEKDKVGGVPETIELQATLRELNQETGQKPIAVYTIVGVRKFHALIVTADNIVSVSPSVTGTEVNEKARQLWGLLQSADYDPTILSNELYGAIFKPIEDKLPKDTKTIMWSLDGNLHYIPMAALYDGKQYLIERYNNIVFTRLDKERMTRAVSPVWTGYGFSASAPQTVSVGGNTVSFAPLDFVKDEMQIFRTKSYPEGVIDGDVLTETQFTKTSFLRVLKQQRPLVHISSHFRFLPGDESRSFLLLGDGEVMTLAELKEQTNLFKGIELLTLSACDTAAQRPDATGREIDAFAEVAQRLGASGVIASLWTVQDRSTSQLMKEFYINRERVKLTKAEALRKAQLDLLYGNTQSPAIPTDQRNAALHRGYPTDENIVVDKKYRIPFQVDKRKPFAHPYYWSPFVLFGNWK